MGMKAKDGLIKIVLAVARIVFGMTFIFSGFVKAVDPMGFAYKIEDYLISFQLTQFIPLALTFAVVLILVEFLLGVLVLLGIYRKVSASMAVLFMMVMTPMTLYIALENPVKDCGCFGDALVISNWATFYKNIVLLTFTLLLFAFRNSIKPFFSHKTKNIVLGYVVLFSLLFCLYNILYLPIMDFRPYKVGVNIPEQMEDDLTKGDVYENIYIYEKNGEQEEFTDDTFPWEDSTWTFVDLKSELIQEAEQPVIEEFYIVAYSQDASGMWVKGDDITDEVLHGPVSLLVVSLSLDDANNKGMEQIATLADFAANKSIGMQIATASGGDAVKRWSDKLGSSHESSHRNSHVNFASMDELTLKTIVRSNPGLLLLNEGTIMAKWGSRNLPSVAELEALMGQFETGEKRLPINNSLVRLLILCVLFVLPLLGVKWYDAKAAILQGKH